MRILLIVSVVFGSKLSDEKVRSTTNLKNIEMYKVLKRLEEEADEKISEGINNGSQVFTFVEKSTHRHNQAEILKTEILVPISSKRFQTRREIENAIKYDPKRRSIYERIKNNKNLNAFLNSLFSVYEKCVQRIYETGEMTMADEEQIEKLLFLINNMEGTPLQEERGAQILKLENSKIKLGRHKTF